MEVETKRSPVKEKDEARMTGGMVDQEGRRIMQEVEKPAAYDYTPSRIYDYGRSTVQDRSVHRIMSLS